MRQFGREIESASPLALPGPRENIYYIYSLWLDLVGTLQVGDASQSSCKNPQRREILNETRFSVRPSELEVYIFLIRQKAYSDVHTDKMIDI